MGMLNSSSNKLSVARGALLLLMAVAQASCAAQYMTIRRASGATATDPGGPNSNDSQSAPSMPTAGLEVLLNDQSVTAVPAGAKFKVRPTLDTADANDIGKVECDNPGIIEASFQLQGQEPQAVNRSAKTDCTDLVIESTYDKPGKYQLTLIVTSDEGKQAQASMTLSVFDDSGDGLQHFPGFRIFAEPMIAKVDDDISFSALCDDNQGEVIRWNFGDGATAEGLTVKHAYTQAGSMVVQATCITNDGVELGASVTVVIQPKPGSNPQPGTDGDGNTDPGDGGSGDGDTDPPGGTNPPDGTTPPGGTSPDDGSTIPDDDDGGQPGPGQNPGQSPAQNSGK